MAFSLSQILHSRLQITWGAKGAFELRSLIRKRNQTNQLQTKLHTSGPGGRRFKSSLPDQYSSTTCNLRFPPGHPKGHPFVAERFGLIRSCVFCILSGSGNRFYGAGDRVHSLFPPTLAVDVLGHVNIGVAHVVADYLRPCTLAQHQTGGHGAEAPKIYGLREPQFWSGSLNMAQQIAPA